MLLLLCNAGDVDSGDENDADRAGTAAIPTHPHALPYAYGNRSRMQSPRGWGLPNHHETKL